jgi:tRNA(fMet)-specific endonuclease VapC
VSSYAIVDTDVFSCLWQRRDGYRDFARRLTGRTPALSFVSVGEARFGAAKNNWGPRRLSELQDALRRYLIVPFDDQMPQVWGSLKAQAVSIGHPLGQAHHTNDLWIAATAIFHDAPLLTGNTRHFEGFPNLDLL